MTALPHVPISSVAKYSLFHAPVVSFFLKVMEAVPVAQPFDVGLKVQPTLDENKRINKEMFEITANRILGGSSIVIFPEGTCHSTPTIKELKIGTARMALQVASNNGPRIPIVPIGLSYSTPSGMQFRSKVLVDIGRPIEITDELLNLYERGGKEGQFSACKIITDRIERQLRDVTIKSPDWGSVLEEVVMSKGWEKPDFSETYEPDPTVVKLKEGEKAKPARIIQTASVLVNNKTYKSSSVPESDSAYASRLRLLTSTGTTPKPNAALKLEAAKAAYFSISGASSSSLHLTNIVDRQFVEHMHLARRVYKPNAAKITLGMYASLTRNFMRMTLRNLADPELQSLWTNLSDYKEGIETLGITDKYVAMHEIGTDPMNERMNSLRKRAGRNLVKSSVMLPFSLLGHVIHSPVAMLAAVAGNKMGIERDTGDTSVVATMRLIAGFSGTLVLYPLIGLAASLFFGSGFACLPAMGVAAFSGSAAIQYPISDVVKGAQGSLKLLLAKDNVDKLRIQRKQLQADIRSYADRKGEEKIQGWWKDPEGFTQTMNENERINDKEQAEKRRIVTKTSIEQAKLTSYTIKLASDSKRHPDERAVLTIKQAPGNNKALLWIPGRNDSFFHVHVLDRFLDAGFDLYALDLRRCGRAKFCESGKEVVSELMAHDSHDFREYYEEIDATLAFLKNPKPLPSTNVHYPNVIQEGGSGVVYDSVICYSHSTGSLIASMYGSDKGGAWRGAIDGYLFNSPFWSWNLKWYEGLHVVQNATKAVDKKTLIDKGGAVSDYSKSMKANYGYGNEHKSELSLSVSAGWCQEVTKAQTMLKNGEMVLNKPILVLSTTADEILSHSEIDDLSDLLHKSKKDGKNNPISKSSKSRFVERVIGSTATDRSAHDVLAAPSAARVDEAMDIIENWLHVNYDD